MAENEVGPTRPRADSNQVNMKRSLAANGGHTTQSGSSLSRRSSGRRLSLVQRKLSCDLQEDVRVAMSNSEHRGLLYDGLRNGTPDSEYERVERWLDEHPDFVADYFVRKADYRLVSAWVDRRGAPARVSDENWERTTSAGTTAKTSDASESGASPGGARVAFALDLLQPSDASKYTVKAHEAFWLSSRADDSLARLVAKADGIRLRSSMRHSVSGMSMPSSRKVSLNSVAERPSWHSELDERIQASLHNGVAAFDRCDEPLRNGLSNGLELHSRRKSASTRSVALSCAECSCQSTENSRFWCELLVDLNASSDDVTRMGQRVALAVCQLLACESASIFTVAACVDANANAEDTNTKRPDEEPAHLVCRALNVRARTTLEEQAALAGAESDHHSLTLRIGPAGGLVGVVAQTGESVRLEDAYSDERFNHELDTSEWRTQSVLMVPIKTRDGQLVGVAVACNRLASGSTCGATFQFCVSEAGKAQLPLSDSVAECVSDSASRRLSTSPSEGGYGDRHTSTLSELVAAADRHSPVSPSSRKASSQSDCVLRQLSDQVDVDAISANGRKTSQPEFGSRRPLTATESSRPASLPERAYAPFMLEDENTLTRLVGVCAFALRNATHFEKSQLDKRRSEVLLELARCIFREQVELHTLIYKIMMYAQSISRCERCQLLLIDDAAVSVKDKNDSKMGMFSQVYDLSTDAEPNACDNTPRFPINLAVSEYVATTGETVNVADVDRDPRFSLHRADSTNSDSPVVNGCPVRSVLCMPIRNGQDEVIGVCVLANKRAEADTANRCEHESAFERDDERFFEAFTLFCGLGIHQTKMYERAIRAVAKQRVALEVLSYHATASAEEAQRLRKMNIPSARFYQLFDFAFSDFSLTDDDTLKCALRMFIDLKLVETFRIDYAVLCRWLLSVKKNYRNVTYHNWRHALNVAQSMFAMLLKANERLVDTLNDAERLGLLVACLCHDLDHRGTNNQFQIKSASALAQLYSTSVMEHHHFDQACMLLQAKGNEIFCNLSQEQYDAVLSIIEKAILATDLALYFKFREGFFRLVGRRSPQAPPDSTPCLAASSTDWQLETNRSLLRSMMMTACDLSAIYKPWDVQKRIAELVFGEFFEQGDIERSELNLVPDDMMNRHKKDLLPAMQVGYIDAICMPLYDAFALFHEAYVPLRDTCARNRQNWQVLAEVRSQRDREQHSASSVPADTTPAAESSASPPPPPQPSAADKVPNTDTPARV